MKIKRVEHIVGRVHRENLMTRREEGVQALPRVTQHDRFAGGRFEQSARRAIAHARHRASRYVQRERR